MKACLISLLICCLYKDVWLLHVSNALGRIHGGNTATWGRWPFMAAIFVTTSSSTFFCSGAYLGDGWVITAGQCVDGATQFTVQLGSNDLDIKLAVESSSEYMLHPDYNSQTLENDLGLIKIPVSFTLGVNLQPISVLPTAAIDTAYLLTMLGWGAVSEGGEQPVNELHWNTVIAITNQECQSYYGSQIKENMVCIVGYNNDATMCAGDSGAPLVQYYANRDNAVIGVGSFVSGNGCESGFPSGFTRTYPYNDWIRNITGHV